MSIPCSLPGSMMYSMRRVVSEVDGSRVSDSTHVPFPRNSWIFLQTKTGKRTDLIMKTSSDANVETMKVPKRT